MQKLRLTLLMTIFVWAANAQQILFEGTPHPIEEKTILHQKFTQFSIFQIDAKQLDNYLQSNPEQIRFNLSLGQQFDWDVYLVPNDLRSEDYQLTIMTAEGLMAQPKNPNIAFNGYLQNGTNNRVALTVFDHFIYGFFQQGNEVYFIEPLQYLVPGAEEDLFLVYAQSDVIDNGEHKCGADELEENQKLMQQKQHAHDYADIDNDDGEAKSVVACYNIELAIASDFLMFQKYGSIPAVEAHNVGVMNNVATNFDNEFNHAIEFLIVTQFVADCAACDPFDTTTDAGDLLDSFTAWGNSGGFGVSFDMGQLWTDRDFNGPTIGIAWLNGLCNTQKYHCLQDFTSIAWGLRVLTAHEIGHNLSATHDTGSGFIMSPVVNNTNTWSAASIGDIDSYVQFKINTGCLQTCGGGLPPVADFTANVTSGCAPLTVTFTDLSTDATSWLWTFENGSPPTSTAQNPTVTFNNQGTWDVTLEVTNNFGSDIITKSDYIDVDDVPTAGFSVTTFDFIANFINNTTNATSYFWDFGDGNTSTLSDPSHTYAADDDYVVVLEAFNTCGSAIITDVVSIVTPPTAFFVADVTSGCEPIEVQFIDQSSTNVTDWNWTFTGGTPSSSLEQNPLVFYTNPGIYPVELTVNNSLYADTHTEIDYIEVLAYPTADFSYTIVNDTEVHFTNNSTDADSYLWDFGDGNTSTETNPVHTYIAEGSYSVVLIATNPCDAPSFTQVIDIVLPLPPVAGFTANVTNGCADLAVNFTDQSTNATSWQWSFPGGNPASDTLQNPTVTYTTTGTFDVTLIVANSLGGDTITQTNYISVSDVPIAGFSESTDGLDVDFTNNSSSADSYAWDFGDGDTSTDTDPTHTYAVDGTYIVQLVAINSCGNDTIAQIVSVSIPPVAGFTANTTSGCADLTVNFTDQSSLNAVSWDWSFPGGTPSGSTAQNPVVTYTALGLYDVELIVSNNDGDTDTLLQTDYIDVSDIPTAGFSESTDGLDVDFTNNSSSADSYAWDFGDGNTSTDTDPMHTYAVDGTYTVQLIAINSCGNDTITQIVSVSIPPVAGFTANTTSGCADLTVNFTDQSSINAVSWDWSFPGGTPSGSTAQNPVVTYTASGLYDVELIVSNNDGDTDTLLQTDYIDVSDIPTAGFSESTAGLDVDFTNNSSAADSYAWDFGDGNTSTDTDPTHTYAVDGTYTVQLIAINSCGNDTITQIVSVSIPPVAGFTANTTSGCADLTVNFTDQSSINAVSWDWSFPGGNPSSSTAQNPVVTYTASGLYDVELIVSNNDGDTDTLLQTDYIDVSDVPTAGFSESTDGLDVDFTNNSSSADSYAWDFGDGNTSTDTDPMHTYAVDGTYTVQLIAINSCGNDTITQTVSVSIPPVAGFNANVTSGCADLTVNFTDQSSLNAVSWDWSFPGGTPSSSTDQNPVVTYTSSGLYDVELVVSNNDGDTDTLLQTDYIDVSDVPTAGFSESTDGLDVDFTNNSSSADSYAWDFGDGNTSTDTDPMHTYAVDGTYTVQLIAINSCGNDTITQTVSVSIPPVAGFNANVTSGCADLTVNFTDQSSVNAVSWNWSFPGGTPSSSTDQNPVVTYTASGVYDVELIVSNNDGDTDTLLQTDYIDVSDVPTAGFSESTDGLDVDFTNNSSSADSYAWDFGDGNTSTDTDPMHTYAVDGTYTVQLIAINSCGNDTITQSVSVSIPPVAGFNANVTSGCADLTVNFTDQSSINAVSWDWSFPGGTPSSSTDQNPVVTYTSSGLYDVELIVSNNDGDTDTLLQTDYIDVSDLPTAGFSSLVSDLDVNFTNNSSAADSYAWDFGDGNTSTDTDPMHSYAADGTYTVQLIATNSCGNDTTTQTVTTTTLPTAAFGANVTSGCADLTVNFTDQSSINAVSWDWSFPGGTPSSSTNQNPVVTYTASGVYDVELIVSNNDGDTDTLLQTDYIEVLGLPTAGFSESTDGLDVDFTNNSSAADGYAWDFGDGNTSTDPDPMHSYTTDGPYTVQLIAINSCGNDTTAQTLSVSIPPVAGFNANVTSGCADLTVNFTDQSSINAVSWNWSFPGGTPSSSTDQNPVVTYAAAGVYDVELTVSNNDGETDAINQTNYIEVTDVPMSGFSSSVNGMVVDFTNASTNANSYAWDFGDGNTSTGIDPSNEYSADGTYTVLLIATNECGNDTTQQNVVISSLPTADFTANITSGCAPLTVEFTSTSSSNTEFLFWTFEGGDPVNSSLPAPTVVYSTPGVYSVTLVASNSVGNDLIIETDYIVVEAMPVAGFTTLVNGNTVEFNNNSTNANTYSWDFGEGNTSSDPNPQYSYTDDGTYTVVLTATNDCGSVTFSETIEIISPPVAAFSANVASGCAPFEVAFINQSSASNASWLWSFDGGTPASSTDSDPVVVYSTPGTYTVILEVTNAAGTDTYTEVNYIEVMTSPSASFTSSVNGSTVDFNNTSTNATSYEWDFGDGNTSSLPDPSYSYTAAGSYTVVLTAINDCGSVSFSQEIEIESAPNVAFSADVTSGCAPLEVMFTDQSVGNVVSWDWTFEGGTPTTSTEQNPTVLYQTPGIYNVTLEATTAGGTESFTQSGYIIVEDIPAASFAPTGTGATFDFTNTSTGADSYLWNFGDGNTSTEEDPSHTYLAAGDYTVSLTAINECGEVTVEQEVTAVLPPEVVFTADVLDGCAPLTVHFFDQSSGDPTTWLWTFEGGSPPTSTDQNPEVVYDVPGVYSVTLEAFNSAGSNSVVQTGYITVTDAAPLSSFNSTITNATVDFENTSSGVTIFEWVFGDGNTSTDENPTHTYSEDGSYEVTLTVTNSCGTSTITETVVIATPPTAGFGMDVASGCAPLVVNFVDESSTNTASWSWTFAGGTPSSSDLQNPTVEYTVPGTYDVTLEVTNAQGTDMVTQTGTITVLAGPVAGFTFSGNDLTIDFNNTSMGAVSYEWFFDDGDTSTEENPSHTFAVGGEYDVQLIVTNGCGSDTIVQQVVIEGLPPVAAFEGIPGMGCVPMTVNFTDLSTGAASWAWTFEGGDPATSTDQNPIVTYDTPGVYEVSLAVTNPFGSNSITQLGYITAEDVPVAGFTFAVDEPAVDFTNTSVGGGTYLWDFGDGETSTAEHPVHVYAASGGYTITLTVTNDCGTSTWTEEVEIVIISTELPEDVRSFHLYPNPNNGSFYLEMEALPVDEIQIQLYDVVGRKLVTERIDFSSGYLRQRFDWPHLAAGTYVVEVNLGSKWLVRKIVVE